MKTQFTPSQMKDLIEKANIPLPSSGFQKLWLFHCLLRKANKSLNLSRIHSFETMVRKHYIDSLAVIQIFKEKQLPFPKTMLDIGTGGGLPGIPLAIFLPETLFVLAESRRKRTIFLEETVSNLQLPNVNIFTGSITSQNCPPTEGSITRALETMALTLERISDSLVTDGIAVFMKGPKCSDELDEVNQTGLPYQLLLDHHYILPDSQDHRRLVIWKKLSENASFQAILGSQKAEEIIHSRANPRFKLAKALQKGKQTIKRRQTLVCGKKFVSELLENQPKRCRALLCPDRKLTLTEQMHMEEEIGIARSMKIPEWSFSRELFHEIDFLGSRFPILLVDTPQLPAWDFSHPHPFSATQNQKNSPLPLVVLLPLSDPVNLGASLRSCAAFPVLAVVLLSDASSPFHPRAIRAAAGQCFQLPLFHGRISLQELGNVLPTERTKTSEHPCFALDTSGEPLSVLRNFLQESIDISDSRAKRKETIDQKTKGREETKNSFSYLLIGSEGQGIPKNLDLSRIHIPTDSSVESLNAGTALAITLYTISEKSSEKP